MNMFDRAVAYVAPAAGMRRAAARLALDQYRAYDGAKMGRRTDGWRATNASANVEVKAALHTLRARSRDLTRNTWWGTRIKTVTVAHAVGTGIMPKPNTGSKTLDKKAKAAWKKWSKHCDREGQLNFSGLLALAAGSVIEAGEVLGHMVPVSPRSKPRGVVPLELQLLEPDHLDASRDRVMMSGKARAQIDAEAIIIDQGIEYDLVGKRRAFWIHPQHPGARGLVMPTISVRVPASDMLHVYRKDRIGQGRGVPWLAPVMLTGRDFADLQEAIVVKSRIEACLAAFVKTSGTNRNLGQLEEQRRGAMNGSRRIETIAPGMVAYLEQGEEIQTIAPSGSMQFEGVLRSTLQAMAAGAGLTYDQLTGDLTRANFSSLKAGKIEFRRVIEQFQYLTLVAMFLEPLWDRWCEMAMDAGILPRRADGYPVEWIMPANEPIDPMKEMQADILAVRSGRMTWQDFVLAWGIDPDVQMDQIAEWFAELDKRNIVLDTDPRNALQSTKGGAAPEAQTEVNQNVKQDGGSKAAGKKAAGK
ncbi:MAG: phage portal protein [Bradyrhizobium sp.]